MDWKGGLPEGGISFSICQESVAGQWIWSWIDDNWESQAISNILDTSADAGTGSLTNLTKFSSLLSIHLSFGLCMNPLIESPPCLKVLLLSFRIACKLLVLWTPNTQHQLLRYQH